VKLLVDTSSSLKWKVTSDSSGGNGKSKGEKSKSLKEGKG